MSFTLGNLTCEKGRKVSGYLDLPFTEEDKLPCTIICGANDGPTVLVSGGLHNAEYIGIEAAMTMAREFTPEVISGTVIIIHILNINGFKARTISLSAADGKNLNRVFPGDPEGTYTDKFAHWIEKTLFPVIDYHIDLHCGDWFEDLSPYIYCQNNAAPEVAAKSLEIAKHADVPFYVPSNSGKGGAYNYAGTLGIPGVLLERGGRGILDAKEVQEDVKDTKNMLRYLGVYNGPKKISELQHQVPTRLDHAHYIDSVQAGCWFPLKRAGDIVEPGETVGILKDYLGNIIEEVVINEECIILYQTVSYTVPKDTPLIAYGHYDTCVDEDMDCHHEHRHDHGHDLFENIDHDHHHELDQMIPHFTF